MELSGPRDGRQGWRDGEMGGWRWGGAVGHVKWRLGGAQGWTGAVGLGGLVGRGMGTAGRLRSRRRRDVARGDEGRGKRAGAKGGEGERDRYADTDERYVVK